MEFSATTSAASKVAGDCIIVGVYQRGNLGIGATIIDKASGGTLRKLIKRGDISGNAGQCTLLHDVDGVRASRIAVVGLGNKSAFDVRTFKRANLAAANAIKSSKISNLVNTLSQEELADTSAYYKARFSVEIIGNSFYSFTEQKSTRKPRRLASLKKMSFAVNSRSDVKKATLGAIHADAIVEGMSLARDLGNLSPNVCTPSYLAKMAQKIGREHKKLTTRVIGESEIKRLGMRSFLSVTNGTTEPAKLIVMQYKGDTGAKPVVLVGKGITFDAGGISLKPGPGMDEMKFDMCGAAAAIAAISVVARLQLAINLTVVVPTCENLPGGNATRPGDIIKSMSGKTIEVLNTDAEGRLILVRCTDLFAAIQTRSSSSMLQRLTGACVVALGHHRTASHEPQR